MYTMSWKMINILHLIICETIILTHFVKWNIFGELCKFLLWDGLRLPHTLIFVWEYHVQCCQICDYKFVCGGFIWGSGTPLQPRHHHHHLMLYCPWPGISIFSVRYEYDLSLSKLVASGVLSGDGVIACIYSLIPDIIVTLGRQPVYLVQWGNLGRSDMGLV